MARVNGRTELTEIAIKATESRGELDGLLLKWSGKVKLDSWVNRKTICREDAQDLKQEVLTNIFERFGEFEPDKANFETWAFNRARQIIRSWIRSRIKESRPIFMKGFKGRETVRGAVVEMPEEYDAPSVDKHPIYGCSDGCKILVKKINRNLDNMKMRPSKLIPTKKTLKFLQEDKEISEIAGIMNVSESQIKAHIGRLQRAVLPIIAEDLISV
jgi:RNA polymerase sigma factor (sigma-70 family)